MSNPDPILRPALTGDRRAHHGAAGAVSYCVQGNGRPLLLVHSINAAASSYEMKPIYDRLGASHRVYAPDLPGFGLSDRTQRAYSADLYVSAMLEVVGLIRDDLGDIPVDVVALSLACEFVAKAAWRVPGLFGRLVFVTPTGFQKGGSKSDLPASSTRQWSGLLPVLSLPLMSDALYAALVSRSSIRYFLRKTYGSDAIDAGLLDYSYDTAHQRDAKHAPLAFLSGALFAANPASVYKRLTQFVWMPHATRGDFSDFSEAGWTHKRANWFVQPFDTGALVHFEQPDAFARQLQDFLEQPRATAAAG
jgi:pimeloyl-ACP methyl ester carboxylesterase